MPANVLYEIFASSFHDGNGDARGDLAGIIARLDYIADLGADMLWLMPIHPSPSYHQYDVTDYYAVAPHLGTLADFDALIAACRARGIRVILDLVINHTSSQHPWFIAACEAVRTGSNDPYRRWYNFSRRKQDHWYPVPGAEGWYYEGQFVRGMPDLNLDTPAVRAEIASIMQFWLERGAAGFRLDAVTSYYTGDPAKNTEMLRFITRTAKAYDPDAYIVGEVWAEEDILLQLYESGVDSLFNFPFANVGEKLLTAVRTGKGAPVARAMADWHAKLRAVSPASVDAPFLTNHDVDRVADFLADDVNRLKAAAMLYLLFPGRPAVYYGEELGMTGAGRDENKRMPMLWSAAPDTPLCQQPPRVDTVQRLKRGVAEQADDPDSLLNLYRTLIHLRGRAPELLRGRMTALDAGHEAVAFFRVEEGDHAVAAAINLSPAETVTVPAPGSWTLLGTAGGASCADGAITLPPVSCALMRIQ